jgi:hypothetical protein
MITDGYLEIHRAAKGRGNPARYRLLNTRFANRVSEKPRSPAIETPFPDENTPYLGTVKEPSTLAADFEAFWKVYPRRIAKKEAQRVFAKVMAGREAPTLEELLEAVERYSSSQPDLKYVAYPATWLRQGRWADESGVVAPKPKRPDVELENAYGIIAPMAHLGKTWEECLRLLERYSDRVIEPCYAFYESIRRKYE